MTSVMLKDPILSKDMQLSCTFIAKETSLPVMRDGLLGLPLPLTHYNPVS